MDPRAELAATLSALRLPPGDPDEHAGCRFPARRAWLQSMGFDLPAPACPRFERWSSELGAEGAALVFADAFLENPVSMYGHTFLRLRRRSEDSLLDYTINFAGDTGAGRGALLLTWNGITGGYPGRFSTTPFYLKALEYNDLERRDLWEYELNVSSSDLAMLVRHAWELGSTWFDYYFFSENCSYQLLALFDGARPDLGLAEEFGLPTIPVDTLRAFLRREGLVSKWERRPSFWSDAVGRRARLSPAELSLATRLGRRHDETLLASLEPMPAERRALVLDSARDYWQARHGPGPQEGPAREHGRWLLSERARLRLPSPGWEPPPAAAPHEGHRSSRAGLGGGASGEGPFQELSYRAALHDLVSRPAGYAPGSQLRMLDVRLRFDDKRREPYLESLDLAELLSLAAFDPWDRRASWRLQAGVDQAKELGCAAASCQYFQAGGGLGLAARWRENWAYALAEAEGGAGPVLPDGWRAGGGVSAGLVLDLLPWWRVHAEARYTEFARSRRHERLRVISAFPIKRDWELRVTLDRETPAQEAGAMLYFYF